MCGLWMTVLVEGGGEGGKECKEVGSGDVLFWSLPGCANATLLSTKNCNF